MTENEELEIFTGTELAEPSPRVDAAILAAARGRRERGRSRRRAAIALASLAAVAGLVAAATGIALRAGLDEEPAAPGGPGDTVASAHWGEDIDRAIDRLRLEVEQIGEMAELIAEERLEEREAIDSRIRECLALIERLEMEIEIEDTTQGSAVDIDVEGEIEDIAQLKEANA